MKKNIQDYKKDATLNKVFRFEEGVMSRREWLRVKMVKGWQAEIITNRDYNKEEKVRNELQERRKHIPTGNPNYPSTAEWLKDKAVLEAGIYKTEYTLKDGKGGYSYVITKTEYDYFNNLQLAEDKATEQMNLSHKIEAGIATDQEIDEAMQKEFDYAAKYF